MFMIYRDTTYTNKYRVCYFTELDEHKKEAEINKAFAGVHYYDGFIKNFKKDSAKEIIDKFLQRLKNGEQKLVYYEQTNDIHNAIQREKELKKWNRQWKINLIEKFNPNWNDIYDELTK